jgi:hypothetical protein
MANCIWKAGTRTEKCVHKQDHETDVDDEEARRTLHQIIEKNRIIFIVSKF